MHAVKILVTLSLLFSHFSFGASAHAVSPNIVISQVQTGGVGNGAATQEFVELFNNSTQDVEITGWCIKYSAVTDGSQSQLGCVVPPAQNVKMWLKAGGYISFTSTAFETATGYKGDVTLTPGMAAGGGHIRVLANAADQEVDKIGWGDAQSPETSAAEVPDEGKVLQRLGALSGLRDTDNNSSDFKENELAIHSSGLYETEEMSNDVCSNLDGAQETVPLGYINQNGICVLDLLPLQITELLPNATGADTGREYIELYNPTDRTADLSLYTLHVGLNNEKSYQFPAGSFIGAGEYKTFYDSHVGFTLANTTGQVALAGIDGAPISQTEPYADADDDHAWANISGAWQYTNQPTPGEVNLLSLEEEEEPGMGNAPAPCPEGKYRNPLTNRCRNIETDASVIAACDADEYRNPETNRCRKIATASSLAPCKDGQYRSEETNRCRSIETASAQLVPCKEGQERSPETNRCRKAESSTVPKAGYAVQSVQDGAASFIGWWALGGVGVLALGYAGWEWRYEIMAAYRRALSMFNRR